MRASNVNQFILETLGEGQGHLTAQQVYERIRTRLPAVNPSTIYRALERLARAGKISISDIGTGAAVYELAAGELHHHLVCQGCGNMFTVEDHAIRPLFQQIEREQQFQVVTNHLILFGYCRDCRKPKR